MSLLIVGTVAFDAIETPFGKTDKILGGAATYIGLSASRYLDKQNLVSVVGEDFPQEHMDLLSNRGVDLGGLQIKKGEKTFFWSGKYRNDMNTRDTLDTQLNVLGTFDPIVPENYKDCKYLMLGNLMPSIQQRVLDQLPNRPKLIVLDTMNFWMDNFWDDLIDALKNVDVLTINDEEARQLSGEYSLVKAAKKILGMGPKNVIIKKGEHGALLFNHKEVFFAPALPLEEVFDPTGAGDTFAGGFIGYLAKTDDISFENIKRAIIHGSAMASFCVEKFGTERLQGVDENEVEERLNAFIDLVQVEMAL
ncbi:PfkB family carbohydrate kinase [Phaeocystidibacter marisrubri]|uniref:Sugar kinase n=1 Tax=Phaeocystidibacter marisrubri TaxID=1577780 RepID=A0A6L3ZFX5_9FLAO|nr:PfkB family carbohydrate kinase [Phaeocystidibacter marisrubri]KAB2816378.1 sugar kinase [Phaeocystidibacter marisrubri]GGH68752.1 sugar kinase [Phaeocystidibacter marisrubri]